MGYNKITLRLVLRIILILLSMLLLSWLLSNLSKYRLFTTTFMLVVVIGLQVWELIRWLQKTNRVLYRFFEALKQGDFTTSFDTKSPGSTEEILLREMNRFLDNQSRRNFKLGSRIGFLEVLIEHLPNGIICWGKGEKVVYQNPASVELLGFNKDLTWTVFFRENPDIKKMISGSGGGKSIIYENTQSGKKNLLKIDLWPFTILGEALRVMTIENITAELEKKESDSWQELLRILSHEIRNSITPVSSLTETMASILKPVQEAGSKEELSDQNVSDIIQAIDIIQVRTVRLKVFTENVLKVTRIPVPDKVSINIKAVLDDILQYMKSDLDENKISVALDILPTAESVFADPIQLELILTNLITNSIPALKSKDNAKINIRVVKADDSSRIIFEDNGCGIFGDLIEKIFMPFFTTKKDGHGLGLSIVRQMVTLHGGSIYCESEVGEWTRFVLEFPM